MSLGPANANDDSESDLRQTVEQFRAEALAHRDLALAYGAEQVLGYRLMTAAIKAGRRAAIAGSERV